MKSQHHRAGRAGAAVGFYLVAPTAWAFNLFDGGGFLGYDYLKWGPPQVGTAATVSWSILEPGTPGDVAYCGEVCPGVSATALNFYDHATEQWVVRDVEDFRPIFQRAMLTWSAAAHISFTGPFADTSAIPVNDAAATPPQTGQIRIGAFTFTGNAVFGGAAGYAPPPNGGTGEGDIMFNTGAFYQNAPGDEDISQIDFAFGNDVESLFLHELGHAIGLAHSDDPDSVMYIAPDGVYFLNRELSADDIAGAQMLYGPPADFDSDGQADVVDNCTESANPDQLDADGDGIGNACDGDLDNNCMIDFADLALLKAAFFSTDPVADLDGNGNVDFPDLAIMKALFFGPPGPSGLDNICDS